MSTKQQTTATINGDDRTILSDVFSSSEDDDDDFSTTGSAQKMIIENSGKHQYKSWSGSKAMTSVVKTAIDTAVMVAVTIGSPIDATICRPRINKYNKLYKQIAITCMLLLGATGTSLVQLGHMMGMWNLSYMSCAISMFLWGCSFAIPFYIPPSLYALQRGDASATIADAFDIGGFLLLAAFNGYVASIPNKSIAASWIPTFQITTLCSLMSFVTLSSTVWREWKKEQQQQQLQHS